MTTNFSRVVAYDKVIKVAADTVKLEMHKEEIKLVEQSKAWVYSLECKGERNWGCREMIRWSDYQNYKGYKINHSENLGLFLETICCYSIERGYK